MKNICKISICITLLFAFTYKCDAQSPTLWGMSASGENGSGNIFTHAIGSSTVVNSYSFTNSETPYGSLILSKDLKAMFGMTYGGGSDGLGTVFRYDLNNRLMTVLHDFKGQKGSDGSVPYGRVLEGSDGALYGMTSTGGKNNLGVVFRWEKGNYKVIHDFEGKADGATPYGSLIEIDGTLFGMTSAGGDATGETTGLGTIFSLKLDGSNHKVFAFPKDGNQGATPYGSLVVGMNNNTLIGMTFGGGSKESTGVLFYFDVSKFMISNLVHGFSGGLQDGANPYGDILYMPKSNLLVGLTYRGGTFNQGTLFTYELTKNTYLIRYNFNTDVGSFPFGTLINPKSDSTFVYGVTTLGGTGNMGRLFKWNPNGMVRVTDFDGKNVRLPYFNKLLEYIQPPCPKTVDLPTVESPANFCVGNNTTPLKAVTNIAGADLIWYGQDGRGIPTTTATVPNTSKPGTFAYVVSQIINGCESAKATITVQVSDRPAAPGVITPLSYCEGAVTSALTATQTAKGDVLWYGTNATGGVASTTAPIPPSNTVGTTNYYVAQTNEFGCESPRTNIAVTIISRPLLPGTSPRNQCLNATATALTATPSLYTIPTNGSQAPYRLNWYGTNSTGGTASTTAPIPATNVAGTVNYYVSQTHPLTGCEGPRAIIAVTTSALPAPPTVTSPITVCQNGTAPTLTAVGSALKWYGTNATGGTPTTTPPIPPTNVSGAFNYYVSQTNANGCESPRAAILFNVNTIPTAPVLSPSTGAICQYSKSPDLISYIKGYSGTLLWYTTLTGGKPIYDTPKIDSTIVTTHTYYLSNLVNGCESARAALSVSVNPTPSAPLAPVLSPICSGTNDTLHISTSPVGSYYWFTSATGGNAMNSPYYTPNISNNTTFYVIDSVATTGCKSPRTPVVLRVNPNVTPAVNISTPSTTICAGSNAVFTATPTNGGASPTYRWFVNGNIQNTTTQTFSTNTLANNDSIWVIMTSNATCLASVTASSAKIKMSVGTGLTPGVQISTSSTSICSGSSITFSSSIANGGTGPIYQWKINGNNVGTNSSTFTSNTLQNRDTVSLVLTSNATCLGTIKTATSNKIVMSVSSNLSPSVTINSTSNSICTGASVTFTALPTNGGTAPSYQWRVNGTNVTGATTSTYTSNSLSNNSVVSVVLTSNATCLASNQVVSTNNITVSVNSTLTPSVTVATADTSVCVGTAVLFTATPTHGGTTPSYQWKLNGLNVGTNSATYTNNSLTNDDRVSVVMTSNANCASSNAVSSGIITMQITNTVVPSVTITAASATTICAGTALTFNALPTHGGTTPSYQWRIGGVNVSGATSSTFTSSTLEHNSVVSVVMSSSAACRSTNTATSNGITVTVNPNIVPSVTISTPSNSICANTSQTFSANPTHGGTGASYQWRINGTNIQGEVANTFTTNTLANNNTVSVVMTSTAACRTANTAVSNNIVITVNPTTTPSVSITSPTTTICPGTTATFTAVATNAGTPLYEWMLNGISTGTNSPTFTSSSLTDNDEVSAIITSSNACVTRSKDTSNYIRVSMSTAPFVSTHPLPNVVCTGATASFSVSAIGTGLSYQWRENGTDLTNSTRYAGVNTSVLTISNTALAQTNNQYSVLIKGSCLPNITSNSATLTVNPPPHIITQPSPNATCDGGSVHFSVKATGFGLTYQWLENGTSINDGSIYSGTTKDTLKLTGLSNDQNGNAYSVIVSGCTTSVSSNPALLTVGTNFTTSVTVSASQTIVCNGTPVTFTATPINGGPNPSFQWLLNGILIPNENSLSYTTQTLKDNDRVSCQMTSSNTCVSTVNVTSSPVIIEVNSTPPTITNFNNGAVCDTGRATLAASASAGVIKWYHVSSGGLAIDSGETYTTPQLLNTALYYADAFYKGCYSTQRTPISAFVDKKPVVFAGVDQNICESVGLITLTGNSSTQYLNWTSSGSTQPIREDSLSALYTIQPVDVTSGSISFVATSDRNGSCVPVSDTVRFKIAASSADAGYVITADSAVVAAIINYNFPSTQTAYKANDPLTWVGIKTACGYITEIRLPSKELNGTLLGIENLSKLEVLDLSSNSIDSLASDLGLISSSIRIVNISGNNIDYKRPIMMTDYIHLDTFDLSANKFSNSIDFINHAPKSLNLSHNLIQSLHTKATTTENLRTQKLDISHNLIEHLELLEIDSLKYLRSLNASHNSMWGPLTNVAVWKDLDTLDLSHNLLAGNMIDVRFSPSLKYIDLGNNRFNGNLTWDLSNLNSLKYFAIDSNNTNGTETGSGITSLPLFPPNLDMTLKVQDNHLDFIDLEPYTINLSNPQNYIPQYDSVDVSYTTKPAALSYFNLNTSLAGHKSIYQWKRYSPQSQAFEDLRLPTANEKIFKKQFANSDTGTYTVTVTNSDFPGLEFHRRPIQLEACDFSYNINFVLKKPTLDKCFNIDTLSIEFTNKDNTPVKAFSTSWQFNSLNVYDAVNKQIPIHVSGNYSFLAYDSVSGCSVLSKDTLLNRATIKANVPLEIQFNEQDSTITNTNVFTTEENPSYQWLIDGFAIAGAHEKSLRLHYNGTYQLISVNKDDCSSISTLLKVSAFNKTFVRTEHSFNSHGQVVFSPHFSALKVYPNPATDAFTISGLANGSVVTITNAQGHIIRQTKTWTPSVNIETSDYPAGLYLISIHHNNKHVLEKIVIE